MVVVCENIEEIANEIKKTHSDIELDKIISLDFPFLNNEQEFTLISIPSYGELKHNFIYASKKIFVLSIAKVSGFENNFKQIINKKYGKSTVAILLVLKSVLRNYAHEFERIREVMNRLEVDPRIDIIEDKGRELRKLTDRMEGLLQMILELKEREIKSFDTALSDYRETVPEIKLHEIAQELKGRVFLLRIHFFTVSSYLRE